MTQEEKNILLKDLCARLPYGVKVKISDKDVLLVDSEKGTLDGKETMSDDNFVIKCDKDSWIISCDGFKPYLRPMSSMTEDEKMEWFQMRQKHCNMSGFNELQERADFTSESSNWLNTHHFDYRGLIPMGLALEAPKDMYEIQKEEKDIEEIKIEIPKNLEEALSILNEMVSDEDKEYLKANGAISAHFSLGMWIRNNFGLWDNSEFYEYLFNEVGLTHPDDMSNYVIEEFIKTL